MKKFIEITDAEIDSLTFEQKLSLLIEVGELPVIIPSKRE